MSLQKFYEEFKSRHDFEDEDLGILKERHPNINITNIPIAWIVIVDELLCRARKEGQIQSIDQSFGCMPL